jgi:hypothetical protein
MLFKNIFLVKNKILIVSQIIFLINYNNIFSMDINNPFSKFKPLEDLCNKKPSPTNVRLCHDTLYDQYNEAYKAFLKYNGFRLMAEKFSIWEDQNRISNIDEHNKKEQIIESKKYRYYLSKALKWHRQKKINEQNNSNNNNDNNLKRKPQYSLKNNEEIHIFKNNCCQEQKNPQDYNNNGYLYEILLQSKQNNDDLFDNCSLSEMWSSKKNRKIN